MNLIATSKIAAYIDKHPEARVPLLTWLKEWPYRPQHVPLDAEGNPLAGSGHGQAYTDGGDYIIKFRINYAANTMCITWVGTSYEFEEERARELLDLQQKYAGSATERIITKTVVIKVPQPQRRSSKHKQDSSSSTSTTSVQTITHQQLPLPGAIRKVVDKQNANTETEYDDKLAQAIALIEAQSGTPEFDKLLAMLPAIESYEEYQLKFPSLFIHEVIAQRLKLYQMIPLHLNSIVGSEDKVRAFLSGELKLSDSKLQRLMKKLGLRSPVIDERFA